MSRTVFLPRSGPNFSLRPEGALLSSPRGSAFGPTISFLKKETVPPGGTREKSSGPGSRSSSPKLKCAPTPHKVFREAPSPSQSPLSKKKGLTGEHGSIPRRAWCGGDPDGMDSGRSIPGAPAVLRGTGRAGKSRAARGAVPHCISAEMPRLSPWRVLSWTAPAARSLCSPTAHSAVGALFN